MDLELNDDQAELRAIAKDVLARRGDLAPAREFLDGHGDASGLAAELTDLGWASVGLDEDDPFGIPGLCLLAEQVGAHVSPVALVDGAVVARLAVDTPQGAVDGPASLCVVEEGGGWSLDDLGAVAEPDGHGEVRITATKLGVHHGADARVLAVLAMLDGEPAALLVPADAPGCRIVASPSLDPSAAATAVILEDVWVPTERCVAGATLRAAMSVGTVATAAEAVGAASRALTIAVNYALERHQFGRPIGSFQALQHRLADMYVKREAAWSTVLYAATALDEGSEEAPEAVAIAKAYASRATRKIIESALQVLGGIGFTWEHDVHLLQRRVLECERRFGDTIDHERRLAAEAARRSSAPAGSLLR